VLVTRQVEKVMHKMPPKLRRGIDRIITGLAANPRPHNSEALQAHGNLYRIPVGDWRIIYAIEEDELIVLVLRVAPRSGAYDDL